MDPDIEVVGVYPIAASEPCHLVELIVRKSSLPIDFSAFTQSVHGQPRENWQVPWDEMILDSEGRSRVTDSSEKRDLEAHGDVRIAFFLHYLDFSRPLITPFGEISVPPEARRPDRLAFVEYEPP